MGEKDRKTLGTSQPDMEDAEKQDTQNERKVKTEAKHRRTETGYKLRYKSYAWGWM